jgi:hypothetical protein
MGQITITIAGASRSAVVTWAGTKVPVTDLGGGGFSSSFPSSPGGYVYSIVVFGDPGDPWTAKVTDGTKTNNHAGHMSPAGYDTTGDTPFTVT